MKSIRDRYGPLTFLAAVMAALVLALFLGAPGAQAGEMDTGLSVATIVSYPAELVPVLHVGTATMAMELYVYFAESELRVETNARALPAEIARYESGRRSGVGKRSLTIASYAIDLVRPWDERTGYPLRC